MVQVMECMNIPKEILEFILKDNLLSFYDVCNFGSTCSSFWSFINCSNQIWKTKFQQRWPQLMKNLMLQRHPVTDWLDACKQRFLIGRQTMKLVMNMSALHMMQEELSACEFRPFEELYSPSGPKLALLSIIDELMLCANHENRNTNLTSKYYCEKVLRYLRQLYLSEMWDIYKNLPTEEQLLERGAVIVAQWCQPLEEITDTAIATELDVLADEVRARLRQEHGISHPALLVPAELRAQWQRRNLTDNHYSPSVSLQVLQTVSTMFKQLGFFEEICDRHPFEDSFINKVLELHEGVRINTITPAVVFESVTRRLGIKCEPLINSCSRRFMLGWRGTYRADAPSQYFYIDVTHRDTLLDMHNYSKCNCCSKRPASATKVVECMCLSLMAGAYIMAIPRTRRSALELSYLVNPTCLLTIEKYVLMYMEYKLDLAPMRRFLLENISNFDGMNMQFMRKIDNYCDSWQHYRNVQVKSWKVKRREDAAPVKYAVGMVLSHLRWRDVGVVTGWDPQYNTRNVSDELTNSNQHQPFYHVLMQEGTYRYMPEGNLELENSPEEECKWIPDVEVGRYFDRFCGTYYQPNSELESHYPDDMPVLRMCLGLP